MIIYLRSELSRMSVNFHYNSYSLSLSEIYELEPSSTLKHLTHDNVCLMGHVAPHAILQKCGDYSSADGYSEENFSEIDFDKDVRKLTCIMWRRLVMYHITD